MPAIHSVVPIISSSREEGRGYVYPHSISQLGNQRDDEYRRRIL
jgi:hypothetical protein